MTREALVLLEGAALISAAYFGYHWLSEPSGTYEPLFAVSLLVLAVSEWARRNWKSDISPTDLARFVTVGQDLNKRTNEVPLPIQAHNAWVREVEDFFQKKNRPDYIARLNDMSGMVFYGDGSEKSKFRNGVEGRLRRLHEFMSENARSDT